MEGNRSRKGVAMSHYKAGRNHIHGVGGVGRLDSRKRHVARKRFKLDQMELYSPSEACDRADIP